MKTLPSIAIGTTFGKLTFIQSLGINENGHSVCQVKCECGNVKAVKVSELVSGHVKTCGCGSWKGKSQIACDGIVGKTFGRITVIKMSGIDKKNYKTCIGRCECGKEKAFRVHQLVKGIVRSCGCLLSEWRSKNLPQISRSFGHGKIHKLTYTSWAGMVQRCFNKNRHNYAEYGGRGIVACEYLKASALNLISLIGERPSKEYSIDRIDNAKGYSCGSCPECQRKGWGLNVRWSNEVTQCRNRRSNCHITIGGVTKTRIEWANALKMSYNTVARFLRQYETT